MKQAKDYIIFPLDVPTLQEAKSFVDLLSGHVGMFKVGLELFISTGPDIIHYINEKGTAKVFLDLKLHDIPATVNRAVSRIADLNVALATVHCGDSRAMLEAAVKGAKNKVNLLGVTVLTSVSSEDIRTAGFLPEFSSDVKRLVLKRADMAKDAGLSGIVCSGQEVQDIKKQFGKDFLAITPGIRPLWDDIKKDDQKRIVTPKDAIKSGSDYIVIGRPIRDARDPLEAAEKIAAEIEDAI
ncbi:MAG: orotidine-5'-phosphate decarboxylase [Proteobacteria bacterium]|nr:orotidine-5'-phosphate decarboxylase [Pseudomonadota bacterium]